MKAPVPLSLKIYLWFFFSLVIIAAFLFISFNMQLNLPIDSPLRGAAGDRMIQVEHQISLELSESPTYSWDEILAQFESLYRVNFILVANEGHRMAGSDIEIPKPVQQKIKRLSPIDPTDELKPRQPLHAPGQSPQEMRPPPGGGVHRNPRQPFDPVNIPRFSVKTEDPTRYWVGIRTRVTLNKSGPPTSAVLLAVSKSISGNGLFLDLTPWLVIVGAVIALSVLLWAPLLRRLVRSIKEVSIAAESIGRGRFDVRLPVKSSDEIGRLSQSINDMAGRLDGLVKSQKRFLGDIAHELGSPIARLQLGSSILEGRVSETNLDRVKDISTEAQMMSDLVEELLTFAKADAGTVPIPLQPVDVASLVNRIVSREGRQAEIIMSIPDGVWVTAAPKLLARAVSNLLRNAIRYASHAGPIEIVTENMKGSVLLIIRDCGPGVPEKALPKLFDPFYRPEPSRDRSSGGTGLGLAIVKTCVEAQGGTVSAENINPGLAISIRLANAKLG